MRRLRSALQEPSVQILLKLALAGTDPRGAQVVIITCRSCGYFEEHFRDRCLNKAGKPCDRCQGQGRAS